MCFCSDEEDTDDSSDNDSSDTDEQQDSDGELKCHKLNSVSVFFQQDYDYCLVEYLILCTTNKAQCKSFQYQVLFSVLPQNQ